MRVLPFFLALVLSLLGCSALGQKSTVSSQQLEEWLIALSADEMRGRKEDSEGGRKAAAWLAERFGAFGLKPAPAQTGFFQEYEYQAGPTRVQGSNVIGFLKGSDPARAGEYIIISAHFDHLGEDLTLQGDQVYNGADDNASGVTAMLGIAASLAELVRTHPQSAPKRSIVFIGWDGEESGLRGSRYYREHPLFPLEHCVVNLNLEMLGHSKSLGERNFYITGASYSDLAQVVRTGAAKAGWQLVDDPQPQMKLFFRSDNISLVNIEVDSESQARIGIPAHTFSSWASGSHYHQVFDHADLVDYDNLQGFVAMMQDVVLELADRAEWVTFITNAGDSLKFRRYLSKAGSATQGSSH